MILEIKIKCHFTQLFCFKFLVLQSIISLVFLFLKTEKLFLKIKIKQDLFSPKVDGNI